MCLCDTCRCSKALKIQVFAIFTDFESKSSVFNYSKSERNICFLATIWRNYRYKRTRIHLHTQVPTWGMPELRLSCLKNVKRLRREKKIIIFFVKKKSKYSPKIEIFANTGISDLGSQDPMGSRNPRFWKFIKFSLF